MKMLELPSGPSLRRLYAGFFDDFVCENTTLWTTTATDSGTSTHTAQRDGVVALAPSDGTVADNDEIYFLTPEIFLFAANSPLIVEARIQFTEANTDDANVLFGVLDAPAANTILDDGAGPKASYSGAVMFKVDGGTTWSCENSISTTQKTTDLDGTQPLSSDSKTAGGSSFQTLRIESRPISSTKHDVFYWIDGALVAKHKDQVYTSATEMSVCVGAKNGGSNNESIVVDYVFAYQKRAA